MRFHCYLVIALLLFSCKTIERSDKIEPNKSTDVRQEIEVVDRQIVFLYFEIEKRITEDPQIRLNQIQVTEGRMKENTILQASKKDKNLIVQLLDENNQVQVEQTIENPLVLVMEQYSETGEISLNHLELENAQFFIRFNHKNTIKTLKVYSIQSGRPVELYHQSIQL